MITAYIATNALDLPVDFTFELVQTSQLFSFDKLRGDYVPQISFPDTERNRNTLNHPNRFELQRTTKKEYENFELRCNGFLLIRGTLVIDDQMSGYVVGAVGSIAISQQDKLITDATLLTTQTFVNKATYDPDDDDYAAPTLVNPDFFKELTNVAEFHDQTTDEPYEETVLQHYHKGAGYCVNHKTNGTTVTIPSSQLTVWNPPKETYVGSTSAVTPMLFLFPLIEALLKSLKYFKTTSEITDAELLSLCIYNNRSIINLMPHIQTTIARKSQWSDDIFVANTIDYYTHEQTTFSYVNLLPKITVKELLVSVQNLLNIVFVFSNDNTYKIKDREGIITGAATNVDTYFTGNWQLKGKQDSIVKFTMVMDPNDAEITTYYQDLTERTSDFGAEVADITELQAIVSPTLGELRRVTAMHRVYEYGKNTYTDAHGDTFEMNQWNFISIDYQPVKYNEVSGATDVLEITTTAGTVPYHSTAGHGSVRQMGRNNFRKDTEAGFALRLVFDSAGKGTNATANYYLNYRGTNNMIDTRWPRTAAWLASREAIEGYFRFPINFFASLDINKKWRTRAGQFIVDKMVTRFSHAGMGDSKVEGWKV